MPPRFSFQPLERGDLDALHRWMHLPHARTTFGHWTPEAIADVYGNSIDKIEPFHSYTVRADGHPIGMMSWNRFRDYPEMRACYEVTDLDAINCDVLLGEMAHRGLGPGLIRKFLREIAFADPTVTTCVIDPHASNAIAIRAYEKAGFRFVRQVIDFEDNVPLHLMQLSRADLALPTAADALLAAGPP